MSRFETITATLKVLIFLEIHFEMEVVDLLTVTVAWNPYGQAWGK